MSFMDGPQGQEGEEGGGGGGEEACVQGQAGEGVGPVDLERKAEGQEEPVLRLQVAEKEGYVDDGERSADADDAEKVDDGLGDAQEKETR